MSDELSDYQVGFSAGVAAADLTRSHEIERLAAQLSDAQDAVSEKDLMFHQEWQRAEHALGDVARLTAELAKAKEDFWLERSRLDGVHAAELAEARAREIQQRDERDRLLGDVGRLAMELDEARAWGMQQRAERIWPMELLNGTRVEPAQAWPAPWEETS